MGLDQYIYIANFENVKTFKDFPDRFWIKYKEDVKDIKELPENIYVQDSERCPELSCIEDMRKNNLLQGYFERKYAIENCEHIKITKEDIEYLLNTCNAFLSYFDQNLKNQINDYLYSYDDDFDKLNEKFLKVIENSPKCQEIINKKLPITKGFRYGNDELNLWYYDSIVEIKEKFETLTQESLSDYFGLSDYEEFYYSCWY